MQPGSILLVVMVLSPVIGQLCGLFYSGFFLENFHTFYAAPYMHAGSIATLAFGVLMFVLTESPRLRPPSAEGSFRRFQLMLLAVAILSLLNGLAHYWPIIGIGADFVYMVASVAVYFVGRFALESMRDLDQDDDRLARIWVRCSVLCAIAALTAIPLGSTIFVVGSSGVLTIIISLVYLLSFRHNVQTMLILAAPLVLSLAQMNRTTLMIIVLTFFTITAAGGAFRIAFRVLLVMGLLAGLLMITHESVMDSLNLSDTPLGRRMTELIELTNNPDDSNEIALSHRMFEVNLVMTELGKKPSIFWLIGAGSGATLDMTQGRDYSILANAFLGGEQIHNIHLLPAAILYRYGLIGVAVYGYFGAIGLIAVVRAIRRARLEKKAGLELIGATYILMALAEGMSASGHFLTDWLPYFLAAYLDHIRLLRKSDARESETATPRTPARPGALSGRG